MKSEKGFYHWRGLLSRLCIGILLGQLLLAFFVPGKIVEGADFTLEFMVAPNGSEVWSKTASTTVTVTGYDESIPEPLIYYWRSSDNKDYTARKTFTSGETLSHTGDGDWILELEMKDKGTGLWLPFPTDRFRLDNTAPTMNIAMTLANHQPYVNDSWTAESVHVTVKASDARHDGKASSGVASVAISTDNGNTWTSYVNEEASHVLENSGIHTVLFKATDHAGNEALEQRVVKISKDDLNMNATLKQADNTPYTSGDWTKQNVVASIAPSHNQGIVITSKVYSLDEGATWKTYTTPLTFSTEGVHSLWFKVSDEVGNELLEKFSIQIDQTAPGIQFTSDGNENFTHVASAKVTINDSGSGVDDASLSYVWTSSSTTPDAQANWQSFTNGATLSHTGDDGDWYLHIRAQDHVGNMVNKSSLRFRLDNTAPSINITMTQENTQAYANDSWTSQTVQVKANATDERQDGKGSSGVTTFEISTDNGNSWTSYNIEEEASLTFTDSGVYHLHIKAIDRAGNETLEQRIVKISKDGLMMDVTLEQADNTPYMSGFWTKQNVLARASAHHDLGIAISSINYSIDKGVTWIPYTTPLTFSTEGIHSLWFQVEDEAGNELTEQLSIQIDRTEPEIQFTPNGNGTLARTASTKVTVSDLGSDVDEASLSYIWTSSSTPPDAQAAWKSFTNGATLSHTGVKGDWYLHIRGKDHAGNEVNMSSERFRLQVASSGGGGSGSSQSSNAQLRELVLSMGSLTPSFSKNTSQYTAQVDYEVTSFTVSVTPEQDGSAITINGNKVTTDEESESIPLNVGENRIEIVVTAEDGSKQEYVITVTRGTFTTVGANFTDLSGHWASSMIKEAVSAGIVKGYPDGSFRPNHSVTRAEFAVMLAGALNLRDEGTSLSFTDKNSIGSWANQAIAQAVAAGIIGGYEDGSFRPNAAITRAEMVTMIARALELPVDTQATTGFADDANIAGWAKGAVEAVHQLGIVNGRNDNRFVANDSATRAEAVVMILRLLEVNN